jgi:hypothetical protein
MVYLLTPHVAFIKWSKRPDAKLNPLNGERQCAKRVDLLNSILRQ